MPDEKIIPPTPSAETYAVDEDQGDVFTINDPFALFADWLQLAGKTEPNDPNTFALATVDSDGLPNVRMVLLKDVSVCGLTFFTNTESAKGRELDGSGKAAACFHWKTIRRQVRFRGLVTRVSDQDADDYFATRARGAQAGAWASAQSSQLDARETLAQAVKAIEEKHQDGVIPRPPHWTGYLIEPMEIEFWVNRPYRLHDRLCFRRDKADSDWRSELLYP